MNPYDNEDFEIVQQTDDLLSNYNDIPEIAPTAGEMNPSEFEPRDPMPGAAWSSQDDNE